MEQAQRKSGRTTPVPRFPIAAFGANPYIAAMTDTPNASLPQTLDQRSREIFRLLVEHYLEDGEPLGSRNLSRLLPNALSPATIRNVMADLEDLGLVYAPHVSAGRMPTEQGLRFFVDAFMEIGDLSADERRGIESQVRAAGSAKTSETVLTEASQLLSGLSRGAGLVLASKTESPLKHVEFVRLEPGRALAILVNDRGDVENRLLTIPAGVTVSQLAEAANYLNANLRGKTLSEARDAIAALTARARAELDQLTTLLVDEGVAFWGGVEQGGPPRLIVRGRANLLDPGANAADLERLRLLFEDMETNEALIKLLESAEQGPGVRIFIGSENNLFSLSGSSVIVAPYRDANQKVIGALGIIGPTRLNYARIVPMVDFTAQVVGRMLR